MLKSSRIWFNFSHSTPFFLLFLFGFILAFVISSAMAMATAKPAPLIFLVRKDDSINQYYTTLQLGTPPTTMNAVLDLKGPFTWLDRDSYKLCSLRPIPCHSSGRNITDGDCMDCNGPHRENCANATCSYTIALQLSDVMQGEALDEDILALHSPDGIKRTSKSKFDWDTIGGFAIRTVFPYTVLQPEIFKTLVEDFMKKAKNRKMKAMSVVPFGACYDVKTVKSGVAGPDVSAIMLVLQGVVEWRIGGANAMVRVCLALLDARPYWSGAMLFGAHQLENNLLEFDVGSSTFGFSNSPLLHNFSCSHS